MTNKNFVSFLEDDTMAPGKKKILQAAIELFAQQGYQATSTAAIAQKAGLSDATMFKHFKSKAALLQAIVEPLITSLVPIMSTDLLSQLQEHATTINHLIAYMIKDRYYFIQQNWQIISIIINQLLVDQDFRAQLITTVQPKIQKFLQVLQELLQADPQVNPQITAADVLRLIVGQLLVDFLQQYKFQKDIKLTTDQMEAKVQLMTTVVQHAILKSTLDDVNFK